MDEETRQRTDELLEFAARIISIAVWLLGAGWISLTFAPSGTMENAVMIIAITLAILSIFAKGWLAIIPLLPGRLIVGLGTSGFSF